MKKEKISHGASFKGVIPNLGLAGIILSIVLFCVDISFIIPLVISFVSVIMFASRDIVEVDYSNRAIRKAKDYYFFLDGRDWVTLDNFDKLVLGADHEAFRVIAPMHPLFQRDITIRSYDIYLIGSQTGDSFFLKSNKNIPDAQKALKQYSEKMQIEMVDTIKEGWKKNKERRRSRSGRART